MMEIVARLVGEGLSIVGAIASVYLAVGIALAFVEGQFAAMTENPGVRAEVMYRISLLVLCLAVVAFARPLTRVVTEAILSAGDPGAVRAGILRLGAYFVDILIATAAILMAVGIAFGFVDHQLQVLLGHPGGVSVAIGRIVAVVVLGVGAMLTILLSRIVVRALGG